MADPRKYVTAGIDNKVFKSPTMDVKVPDNQNYLNKMNDPKLTNPYTDKPLTSTVSGGQNQNTFQTTVTDMTTPQVTAKSANPLNKINQTPLSTTAPVPTQSPVEPTEIKEPKQTLTAQQFDDVYAKANQAQKATLDEQKRLGMIKIQKTPEITQGAEISPTEPIAQPEISVDFQSALDDVAKGFGLTNYDEFKSRYGDIIDPTLGTIYDLTDPNQRMALQTKLQGIMGAKVGTQSDLGMLSGQRDSILTNFVNGQEILDTYQDITNELKKGKSLGQVAQDLGMDIKKVTDFVQGRFEDYATLTDEAKGRATEDLDIERRNLEEQAKLDMEKIDADMAWVRKQYETQYERTTEQNQVNESNANVLARMTGIGFSTRGLQGIQAIQDQGKQLLDDLTSNYERSTQQINNLKLQLARTYTYNNEKLTKSLNDAIANAKNTYMSNVVAVQEKYGLAGLQGQKAIAEATNEFIKTAQDIYNTNFEQQQQLYQEARAQATAIRQNEIQDQTIRKNEFEAFKEVSGTMTRSQVIDYAKRNNLTGMLDDLYLQQEASAINTLNSLEGLETAQLGSRFAQQIADGLATNRTPQQVLSNIVSSAEFKDAVASIPMSTQDQLDMQEQLLDIQKKQEELDATKATPAQTVRPVNEEKVDTTLTSFLETNPSGEVGGECGSFVNNYLEDMGLPRIFTDPITDKAKYLNSSDPSVGDVVLLDYGIMVDDGKGGKINAGHVGIVTKINDDGTISVRDSNYGGQKKGDIYVGDKKVQERKLSKAEMNKVQGYFDPTIGVQGEPLSDKQFTQSNQVINSFKSDPQVKAFEEAYSQGLNLLSSLNDESGPGDTAAIFQFMKTLDPQSVVRESEFEVAAKSAGVTQYIGNAYERLTKGKKLTNDQREAFGKLAKQFILNKASLYDTKYEDGLRRLKQQSIDVNVFPTNIADQMREYINVEGQEGDETIQESEVNILDIWDKS